VWPWISLETTNRVLDLTAAYFKNSPFGLEHAIPVIDPNRRTLSMFDKGHLANLSLDEWRADLSLQQDASGFGPSGRVPGNIKGPASSTSQLIDQLFGGADLDQKASDLLSGGDQSGVPGGLPGFGDIPGARGGDKKKSKSLDDMADELHGKHDRGIPGSMGDTSQLPGTHGSRGGGNSEGLPGGDLLASIPGAETRDPMGFLASHGASGIQSGAIAGATPGGPFAPPGQLGINGEGNEGWNDSLRDVATGLGVAATVVIAVYAAPAAIVAAPEAAAIGAVAVAGLAAGALIGLGVLEGVDAYKNDHPEPPKEKPHDGDLYPDPMGGGGGNPTQMPTSDGQGGGTPNTMPRSDGSGGGRPNTIGPFGSMTRLPDTDARGGGRPNSIWFASAGQSSIWDENFGGSGPTVRPAAFAAPVLVGSGLRASLVRLGTSTIAF
jgi:hypothetical protein